MGWFDDFSTTGVGFDAQGAIAKAFNHLSEKFPVPPHPGQPVVQNQYKRCPGGAEAAASDGSNVLSAELQQQLDCRNSDRAVQTYTP